GVAAIFQAHGNAELDFILKDAAAGEIYAFGISEAGNDAVLFDSGTVAQDQADGSVKFTGTKIFTTLSPAWTQLGIFGKTPDGSELVFAILDRAEAALNPMAPAGTCWACVPPILLSPSFRGLWFLLSGSFAGSPPDRIKTYSHLVSLRRF